MKNVSRFFNFDKEKGFTLIADFCRIKEGKCKRSFMSVKGFTLIELLVATSIMSLVFISGYFVYRDFSKRQTLENAYKEFRTNIALARQLSLSGEKPSGCSGTLVGYRVNFPPNADRYQITAVCTSGSVQTREIFAPTGISVGSGPDGLIFYPLGRGTNLASNYVFPIIQTGTQKRITVTITKEGNVQR